jgi:hypothetical protein
VTWAVEKDWENFYFEGDEEEDDDEDNEIDKIQRVVTTRKREQGVGNSKKALKWLGIR